MNSIKWSNVPIPEGHLFIFVVGIALHLWLPLKLFEIPWVRHAFGWPILLPGILLAAWAVVTIQDMDVNSPSRIIVSGPYSFSRNPMYVAWTMIYISIAILVNSLWPILFLPALIAFTHYFVIRREEQQLERQFSDAYRRYCVRVRRYL